MGIQTPTAIHYRIRGPKPLIAGSGRPERGQAPSQDTGCAVLVRIRSRESTSPSKRRMRPARASVAREALNALPSFSFVVDEGFFVFTPRTGLAVQPAAPTLLARPR